MTITHVSSLAELNKILGKSGTLTVIDFHATLVITGAGHAKSLPPTFESLSKKYTNSNFVKVDVDEAPDVAQKYSVTAMPTFVFIKGSDEVHRIRGANQSELSSSVERYSSGSSSTTKAFQGTGNKLGDGSKPSSFTDARGEFKWGSQLGTLALLVAAYLFLMYNSS